MKLGYSWIVCKISFFQINTTTNDPLSSFGCHTLHTLIHIDDVTVLHCTPLSALKVCLLHDDIVLLRTEHTPPHYIPSSVLHIVCTGCFLLNALTGSQIKQATLDRRLTAILKDKTFADIRALDQLNRTYLVFKR